MGNAASFLPLDNQLLMNLVNKWFYYYIVPRSFETNAMNPSVIMPFPESNFMTTGQKKKLRNSLPKKTMQKLLYRGSDSDYKFEPFIEACRGEAHTIAVCKTD